MCCFPFEDISKRQITLCRDLLFLLISNCFWHGQAFNNQLDYLFIIYSVPSMRDEFSKALFVAFYERLIQQGTFRSSVTCTVLPCFLLPVSHFWMVLLVSGKSWLKHNLTRIESLLVL